MRRSTINQVISEATACFQAYHWSLPPNPLWDVTDFGLGDFPSYGLVLVNLAEEEEYCEKLMYASRAQHTPAHAHKVKKEDIIVRMGVLSIQLWCGRPDRPNAKSFSLKKNRVGTTLSHGEVLTLTAGERITIPPGIFHEFWPESESCIIGEVSTANDDLNDNYFVNPDIGRFSQIIEDEPSLLKLVSDY
ncbi:MAG: D-lyxose/D-mannose family sugar isomerase [Bacteroidota bacterium]